jgi:type IV secretion system protein VirB9
MSFAYANGGMYKIYCKVGYLTDIRFKPGEKITFVGGGNTAQWTLDTANTGSGETSVAHLYIKPNFKDVNTNLIVNTTNHSYQIVLNSSDWYNPIVSWTYTSEEQIAAKLGQAKDDVLFTERSLNLLSPEGLNFSYKIKKDDDCRWAPTMIFDDGMKTYIKMPSSIRQGNAPVLFIKEKGKKELSLVNYRIKDGYYIVDRLFSQAELRVSEKDYVRIVLDKD